MSEVMRFRSAIALTAIAIAALAAAMHPAHANSANPYEANVQSRILPGWRQGDGTLMAGLEITLAPGWKTYWRAPGDAGVPPQFDWTASRNLAGVEIAWPRPQVFSTSGMRTLGYTERVVLPMAIAPRRAGQPVRLSGTIDIGICDEVCVPIRLDLSQTLDGTATRPDPVIAAALADRPFSAAEAGLSAAACSVSPAPDGLILSARFTLPPTGGTEMAVLETGDPMIWASEPKITRKGNQLSAEFELMNAAGGPFALDRSTLRFTILGRNHAVDIRGCDS